MTVFPHPKAPKIHIKIVISMLCHIYYFDFIVGILKHQIQKSVLPGMAVVPPCTAGNSPSSTLCPVSKG